MGQLKLVWKYQTDAQPNNVNRYSTLTDPVVALNVPTQDGPRKVAYVASEENNVEAELSEHNEAAGRGERDLPEQSECDARDRSRDLDALLPAERRQAAGVSLANGEDKFPATSIVPPYSRNFSLNLVDRMVYTSTTRGCGNATSEVVAMNISDPDHPVAHFYLSPRKASGVWGRGGIVSSPFGMLAQTADRAYHLASGRFGSSVLGLSKQVRLIDSFTPADQAELDARDLELGSSSPVVFRSAIERWPRRRVKKAGSIRSMRKSWAPRITARRFTPPSDGPTMRWRSASTGTGA